MKIDANSDDINTLIDKRVDEMVSLAKYLQDSRRNRDIKLVRDALHSISAKTLETVNLIHSYEAIMNDLKASQ
jgi:pantothenate kinase